jgi:hypothetical protein
MAERSPRRRPIPDCPRRAVGLPSLRALDGSQAAGDWPRIPDRQKDSDRSADLRQADDWFPWKFAPPARSKARTIPTRFGLYRV